MSRADRLAAAKAIGEDVETLVVDAIPGLDAAADPDAWHDARATAVICPRTVPDVVFGSTCVILADTPVEIKACRRRVSEGTGERPGRWFLKTDQHERLLDEAGAYLLAVYREGSAAKTLETMLAVPATIVDEIVADSWYGVDRREGAVAQLPWPQVIDQEVSDGE